MQYGILGFLGRGGAERRRAGLGGLGVGREQIGLGHGEEERLALQLARREAIAIEILLIDLEILEFPGAGAVINAKNEIAPLGRGAPGIRIKMPAPSSLSLDAFIL